MYQTTKSTDKPNLPISYLRSACPTRQNKKRTGHHLDPSAISNINWIFEYFHLKGKKYLSDVKYLMSIKSIDEKYLKEQINALKLSAHEGPSLSQNLWTHWKGRKLMEQLAP